MHICDLHTHPGLLRGLPCCRAPTCVNRTIVSTPTSPFPKKIFIHAQQKTHIHNHDAKKKPISMEHLSLSPNSSRVIRWPHQVFALKFSRRVPSRIVTHFNASVAQSQSCGAVNIPRHVKLLFRSNHASGLGIHVFCVRQLQSDCTVNYFGEKH
jgi:hypothetical protein